MTERILFDDRKLDSWRELVEALDQLTTTNWVVRGHDRAEWPLQTSLEREYGARGSDVEQRLLWQFVRLAPRLLPSHLIPHDNDAAAWLGLIQHYGGPTRLLDVTRSPYVALYFAFEAPGGGDRALWVFDHAWCMAECGRIMAENEGRPLDETLGRALGAQAQLVYSLVHRQPYGDRLFSSFKPFTGVFAVDPWKPDSRQSAQQAMFLCAANPSLSFVENFRTHKQPTSPPVYRIVLPASLREEVLERLAFMNVTAATLFPDRRHQTEVSRRPCLGGLARSLRTHVVRRPERGDRP